MHLYRHVHLWGQLGTGSAAAPALCASAAVTWWSPSPKEGQVPSFQSFHISQFKSPKQGPKQGTNVASPSCPPSCKHCGVHSVSCSLRAGLGQLSQDNLLPSPAAWNQYLDWCICSSCCKSVPKHQPLPANCGVPIFHQELPLTCCSRLQESLNPSYPESPKSTGCESLHTIFNSSWPWEPQYRSYSSKREIKDVVTQNTQVLQVVFLDCGITSHLSFIC